jgi:WD40 repeat protein
VFDCLNQMGKLVIIFDGFDEMADKVDRQKMINNFWELARVVCSGSKVILTSRTEHFPHDRESRQLLNAELESSTAKLKWESPRFELLELAKFNEAQIRRVLTLEAEEKGLSTDIVEKVMVRAELLDLARRPVMTELIIEAMPEIEAGKPVDMSRIYYYAIVRKMDRDIKAERTFTSLADKLYFLCEIAWEMLSTERMKLNYREFPDRIRQIFPQLVTEAKDLDHWHYDMMGQTILIRNADGDYTPAHRSLLEFLVAYKFAAEAGVLKADFVAAMQEQSDCIDEGAMPQDYTWTGYLQACVAAKCEGKKIAPLQGFTPELSKYLRNTFGREPLTKAVIDLIVPMLEPKNLQPLLDLIHSTKGKTEEETRWLGGNAATLLVKKNPAALDCEDLSYTQMANSYLLGANLQKVDFTLANLSNCLFNSVLASKVLAIAISKDGKFFATGHQDGYVRLWEAIIGQLILTYTKHQDWVYAVAISADGQSLVSGSADNTIKHWDIATGKCLHTYIGHNNSVKTVAISADGQSLVSGSADNTIKRWDIATGKCLHTYIGHNNSVVAVAIAPNNQWFVSGSDDKTIKRWDIATGRCLHTYTEHNFPVRAVAIAPDNQWFVSGSYDKTLKRWDVSTDKCLQTYTEDQGWVITLVISSDGQWLVSGSDDKTLKRWDVSTGECLHTYAGHQNSLYAVAISPDGQWLVSGSDDKTLKCWDVSTGKCLCTYTGYQETQFTALAISPDGQWLVSGSDDKTLKRWDVSTGKCLDIFTGHQETQVTALAIFPDGQLLLSSSDKSTLKRWDIFTGQCLHIYDGQSSLLTAIAISPNGRWFISENGDGTLKRWDVATGKCIQSYVGHKHSVRVVAISSDSQWLISGSTDKTFKRWDLATGKCLNTYTRSQDSVVALAIISHGQWFVSSDYDYDLKRNTIKRWEVSTGKCLQTYTGGNYSVKSIAISPDSNYIISCGGDEITIWAVETGECIRTISNRPCAGMRIGGAIGLTSGQIESLKALGAVDD